MIFNNSGHENKKTANEKNHWNIRIWNSNADTDKLICRKGMRGGWCDLRLIVWI
jgi:hypothetical protein